MVGRVLLIIYLKPDFARTIKELFLPWLLLKPMVSQLKYEAARAEGQRHTVSGKTNTIYFVSRLNLPPILLPYECGSKEQF